MTALLRDFRAFALRHDHDPAFNAGYLVLTFLAAAMLNVGAFLVLVSIHAALDFWKHAERGGGAGAALALTLRENLIDLLLLAIALFLTVYFHRSTGLVAVSGILRFEALLLGGFAVTLSRMGVLCRALRAFAHLRSHIAELRAGTAGAWTRLERLALAGAAACVLLTALAPAILPDGEAAARVLSEELVPWNV